MEAELSAKDIKKEVEQHLKDKEKLEQTLPSSIVIGPFLVRVEAVRKKLANKKKALANALLEHLVEKLRVRIEDVSPETTLLVNYGEHTTVYSPYLFDLNDHLFKKKKFVCV